MSETFMELVKRRKSVRSFLPKPIAKEDIDDILEAGRLAPSSQNRQPWRYIVFTDREEIKALAKHTGLLGLSNFFIKDAPCVIILCAEMKDNLRVNGMDYFLVDCAISFHQMVLLATSKGIGSCWMAAFSQKLLHRYLKLPKSWKVVAMSPFGYEDENTRLYDRVLSSFSRGDTRRERAKIVRFWDKRPDDEKWYN